MTQIKKLLLQVNDTITQVTSRVGLKNEDGKIELAIDDKRRLMVVDVIGTPDECRFSFGGFHVSKEVAREFYRKTDWYKDVEESKRKAQKEGIANWRKLCSKDPPKLDSTLKTLLSEMYMATANELTSNQMFDTQSLEEVIKKFKDQTASLSY